MPFGLILAGGGLTGLAWECGVVIGLHEAGVNLRDSDIVLGTSAGSIVGSLLLSGPDPSSLKGYIAGEQSPLRMSGQPMTKGSAMANLQVLTRWSPIQFMDPTAAAAIAEIAARSLTMTEEAWLGMFADIIGPLDWSPKLRIVSIDAGTGERRLWSVDDAVDLLPVVASSCAVPGIFPAVTIGASSYVDGGLWSPTSADLLPEDIDSVLVISPLGGDDWAGRFSDRATARELDDLEDRGVRTELLRPERPIPPLSAFDESQRVAFFEKGLVDGRAAAAKVGALARS
ncbi:patatin-like phospholipase family protein [Skermania sp. ID1734]|uniref:patatin-like phospholipase family protein n=1 Tax=Skermania sp. ID1734 TaxID=2597516 RepID=UPI00117CFC76|nr:patatin-like phospholipase family protein [Skermania sp. ID1734]TSE00254.1 patatin-like phospholipase family protein [Skermania sp. ID1734]